MRVRVHHKTCDIREARMRRGRGRRAPDAYDQEEILRELEDALSPRKRLDAERVLAADRARAESLGRQERALVEADHRRGLTEQAAYREKLRALEDQHVMGILKEVGGAEPRGTLAIAGRGAARVPGVRDAVRAGRAGGRPPRLRRALQVPRRRRAERVRPQATPRGARPHGGYVKGACEGCGGSLPKQGRGRPRKNCLKCAPFRGKRAA